MSDQVIESSSSVRSSGPPRGDGEIETSLCDLCSNITSEALASEKGYTHVENVSDLKIRAETCDLCKLFLLKLVDSAGNDLAGERILTLDDAITDLESRARKADWELPSPCPVFLRLSERINDMLIIDSVLVASGQHAAYLWLHGSGKDEQKPMVPRPHPVMVLFRMGIGLWGWTPDSDESCPIPKVKLPNRVLDLTDCFKTKNRRVRLIETTNIPNGSYATLSYCWGGYRDFLTETKSYDDRCLGFGFHELPRLFQDACFAASYWGLDYLWIDALCIIQDDREDWERQAAQMADIYRNCAVRIAATAAKDPSHGILERGPVVTSVRLKQLDDTSYPQQQPAYFDRRREGKCFVSFPKDYDRDVDQARLNQRAWVVQERLLAPRTVHFCEDHVYLETERWGIMGEDLISQFEIRRSVISKRGLNRCRLMQTRITNSSYRLYDDTSDSWQQIAELYSSCQITYPTDKLIAIRGLIQDRQTRGKFPYLGAKDCLGMWEPTLHEDLLWVPTPKDENFSFLKDLNLPTWAWISYEGQVQFLKDKRYLRVPSAMKVSPICDYELLEITGDGQAVQLPLKQSVSLRVKLNLAKISALGAHLPRKESFCHDEKTSPFRHWPGTLNRPIPLTSHRDCRVMLDDEGGTIGYMALDADVQGVDLSHLSLEEGVEGGREVGGEEELWCARIATLHDETYKGPDPLSRLQYAWKVDQIASMYTPGVGKEYVETPDSYILSYCLVVSRYSVEGGYEYRRRGIAEVCCEWIDVAPVETIVLV